jgi:hypothetical protein
MRRTGPERRRAVCSRRPVHRRTDRSSCHPRCRPGSRGILRVRRTRLTDPGCRPWRRRRRRWWSRCSASRRRRPPRPWRRLRWIAHSPHMLPRRGPSPGGRQRPIGERAPGQA